MNEGMTVIKTEIRKDVSYVKALGIKVEEGRETSSIVEYKIRSISESALRDANKNLSRQFEMQCDINSIVGLNVSSNLKA